MVKKKRWIRGKKNLEPHVKTENRPEKLTPEMVHLEYDDLVRSIAKKWHRTLGQYGFTEEELAQRAYENLSSAAQRYNPQRSSPSTFIHHVVDNAMNEQLRHSTVRKRQPPSEVLEIRQGFTEPIDTKQPSSKSIQREETRRIYRAMAQMPVESQQMLIEVIRGKTFKEIAQHRGVSKQRIFARFTAIRKELARILNKNIQLEERIQYRQVKAPPKTVGKRPAPKPRRKP